MAAIVDDVDIDNPEISDNEPNEIQQEWESAISQRYGCESAYVDHENLLTEASTKTKKKNTSSSSKAVEKSNKAIIVGNHIHDESELFEKPIRWYIDDKTKRVNVVYKNGKMSAIGAMVKL